MKWSKAVNEYAKLMVPLILFGCHWLFVSEQQFLDLHWGIYLALFAYISFIGEAKSLFQMVWKGLHNIRFVVGVILLFVLSVTGVYVATTMVSDSFFPYQIWFPVGAVQLYIPWILSYALMQPAVDTVIFEKMWVGKENTSSSKAKFILALTARVFVETGSLMLFIRPSGNGTSVWSEASMIYLIAILPPMFVYLFKKNEALSYMGEVMYRLATGIIIIGIFL